MIGNLPTIRTEKGDHNEQQAQAESSSGYSIPMVHEQEFNEAMESSQSTKQQKPKVSLCRTDTYQLSPSSSSQSSVKGSEDDEPTDPFVHEEGPSSPEILEISSRYVEEVVSSQSEIVPYVQPKAQSVNPPTPVNQN